MNDLERIFKQGLEDFEEVAPSPKVWWKVYSSMLLKSTFAKLALIFIGTICLTLIVFWKSNNQNVTSLQKNQILTSSESINNLSSLNSKDYSSNENTIVSVPKSTNASLHYNNKNTYNLTHSTAMVTNLSDKKSEIIVSMNDFIKIDTFDEKLNVNLKDKSLNTSDFDLLESNNDVELVENNYEKSDYTESTKEINQSNIEKIGPNNLNEWNIRPLDTNTELMVQEIVAGNSNENFKDKKIKNRNFEIEAFAGPSVLTNKLYSKSDYSKYIDYRNHSEFSQISPNLGVNYRINFKDFFLQTGLNYSVHQSLADYSILKYEVKTTEYQYSIVSNHNQQIIIGYMTDPNSPSNLIPVYGYSSTPDTNNFKEIFVDSTLKSQMIHFKQKYYYSEIPIMIGKVVKFGKFSFEAMGGFSYGRLTKYDTQIIDINTNKLLSEEELNSKLTQNLFNGLFSVGIGYSLDANKVLFIRPEFKYQINSMFNDATVGQHQTQYRLNLGLRCKL